MEDSTKVLICEECRFPMYHIVHMNSIAGEAACQNLTFRSLETGETPRTVPLWRKIEITIQTIVLIGIIISVIYLASLYHYPQ